MGFCRIYLGIYFVRLCWLGHRPFTSVRGDRHPYEVPEFMGCKCCWGHEGFASLKERFDPVTVHHLYGDVEQLVVHFLHTETVADSNSAITTIVRLIRGGYRQVVKASGCDPDIRRFDTDYPPLMSLYAAKANLVKAWD